MCPKKIPVWFRLCRVRSFPFDKPREWRVFMVDFSNNKVTVTVRQTGVEKVTVPAGEFECNRIEVVVELFIIRPKITYWISRESPHFLVKHQGKKGPFTPTYVTDLVSRE
jgi:hypothetical protein